jgi:hypothetical protein
MSSSAWLSNAIISYPKVDILFSVLKLRHPESGSPPNFLNSDIKSRSLWLLLYTLSSSMHILLHLLNDFRPKLFRKEGGGKGKAKTDFLFHRI